MKIGFVPLREVAIAFVVSLLLGAILSLPATEAVGRVSIDTLFWLRQQVFGPRHNPATSPTVVVAIDEETYRRAPFTQTPFALWTPELGEVLREVTAAEPRVVGFDIIMPTSVQSLLPGYERPFLAALSDAAAGGRLVLAKAQHGDQPIMPYPAYVLLAGGTANVRSANVLDDADGIIRNAPLLLHTADGTSTEPSFSLDLAARNARVTLASTPDGRLLFGDYHVPGNAFAGHLVNFDGGASIPTYSFADLFACAQAGDHDFFRRSFAGKAVIFGTVLDVEDRRLTSKRWIGAPDGAAMAPRCRLPVMKSLYEHQLSRDTIPGVYVQAQAVNDLLRREVPRSLTRAADGGILFGLCMIASLAATRLPLLMASILLSAEMLLWTAVAVVAFNIALLLPWLSGMLSALLAFCAMLSYRFTINERDKRLLRRGFSLFLPAGQVEKLLSDRKLPTLGGEAREVTIWFSDIADFTALSESMPPEELVGLLNRYLGRVTELIEAEGGFVDKYLGDGVLAVFGAPRADPAHAARAVAAALAAIAQPIEGLTTRIGLHSGRAVLGNVGSPRRFNYTVIGDAVNLAARLEAANKIYGTLLLTSESVANACPDPTVLREIDRVRVVGRDRPVVIFTPAASGTAAVFADALAAYRRGDLSTAHRAFETLAPCDLVAAFFLERIRTFERNGLPVNWDGVTNLDRKG
jgi:class 3 adenylate cyclase/CHASE2 domain-containing sensor protein